MSTTRRNRQTGTLVTVVRGNMIGLEESAEFGLKWYTICEPHGQCTGHPTRALATWHAADPRTWCEKCNGNDTLDDEGA